MKPFEFNHTELYLLGCSTFFFLVQIIYYLFLYLRIYRNNRKKRSLTAETASGYPPLSVVVYARDELFNLKRYLPYILEQDYPEFEVIVINADPADGDGSDDYLKLLEEKYANLRHSFTPNSSRYISHKKLGITIGIKASKHNWVVVTDANCCPASPNWLKCMADNFTGETEIVLGGYGYEKGKKWMNKKISYDTLFTSMRILGFAIAGSPYAGFGHNIAYKKELFYSIKGFSRHLNLQRGEDDLFVNQVGRKKNTKVETRAQAMMWMKPLTYKKPWREDKLSYVITSSLYKGAQKYLLGAETFSRLLFYASVICCVVYGIITPNYIIIAAAALLWVMRYVLQALIINKTAKSIGDKQRYYLTLPLLDFIHPWQSMRFKLKCRFSERRDFMRR